MSCFKHHFEVGCEAASHIRSDPPNTMPGVQRGQHEVQKKLISIWVLELVNQAITFKGFLKPKVTKERSAVHSKTDQSIKPGDNLKDLSAPSPAEDISLTHFFHSPREDLLVSACAASHEG